MAKAKKKTEADTAPGEPFPEAGPRKMTIYEYEQRYARRQNVRGAKFFLRLAVSVVGIFLLVCMVLLALRVYELNEYAGYATGAVLLLLFIFLFVVPVCRILRLGHFETNVNAKTARAAQKHNRKLRHAIAGRIVDVTATVDGVGWYQTETVGRLAIALKARDEEGIKNILTELYRGSVKKSAKDLIFRNAMRSATYSAISQTAKVDALLVVFVNLQLIKDLVFLYGFRPSDARLMRIFLRVLQNSLAAYGLGGMKIGNTVVKTMGDAMKGIPLLGSAISALVDSSVQGLTNGVLTAVIGYQTIKYLNDEYRLQDILDGVEVTETEEEFEETCSDLEQKLKGKKFAAAG